jgi:hypothetical protein
MKSLNLYTCLSALATTLQYAVLSSLLISCGADYDYEARIPGRPAPKEKSVEPETGPAGPRGEQGKQGQSCVSDNVGGTVIIQCGTSTHQIENGRDGENGTDGADGESVQGPQGEAGETGPAGVDGTDAILEILDPCTPGGDILLRLTDGTLLHSPKGSLTIAAPGLYKTRDHVRCIYTIDDDLTVTDESGNSWSY